MFDLEAMDKYALGTTFLIIKNLLLEEERDIEKMRDLINKNE